MTDGAAGLRQSRPPPVLGPAHLLQWAVCLPGDDRGKSDFFAHLVTKASHYLSLTW